MREMSIVPPMMTGMAPIRAKASRRPAQVGSSPIVLPLCAINTVTPENNRQFPRVGRADCRCGWSIQLGYCSEQFTATDIPLDPTVRSSPHCSGDGLLRPARIRVLAQLPAPPDG